MQTAGRRPSAEGSTASRVLRQVEDSGVIAILRAPDADRFVALTEVLFAAGIVSLELTLTTRGALEALRVVAHSGPDGASVGAGTVLTVEDADAAIEAGAQYLVTPALNVDVVRHAGACGIPIFPGALTPTEILAAWNAGASAVKVFPAASMGGPDYLRNVRGPFPTIPLVPTGGIEVDDAPGYIEAGALAVGVGGPLLGDAPAGGDLGALRDRALRLVAGVRAAKAAARG